LRAIGDPHPPCCLWITPVDNFILKTGAVYIIGVALNNNPLSNRQTRRTTTGATTGATRQGLTLAASTMQTTTRTRS
jgi:hypothetical protein